MIKSCNSKIFIKARLKTSQIPNQSPPPPPFHRPQHEEKFKIKKSKTAGLLLHLKIVVSN